MDDIGKTHIILTGLAVLIFGIGIWLGATIALNKSGQHEYNAVQAALANAVSPLNCGENEIIDTIQRLAEAGTHVRGYSMHLDLSNGGGE